MLSNCPQCGFANDDPVECPHCGLVYHLYRPQLELETPRKVTRDIPLMPGDPERAANSWPKAHPKKGGRFVFGDTQLDLVAVPGAFFVAAMAKILILPGILFTLVFSTPMHNFGHAMTAWLGGRFALPVFLPGFGISEILTEGASAWVMIPVAAILATGIFFSARSKLSALAALFLGILGTMVYLSFVITKAQWETAEYFSGIGAQFVLSTLMILAYYHSMPARIRWDFLRIIVLLIGAYCFLDISWLWLKVQSNAGAIPWISVLEGRNDSNGDLNSLRNVANWSSARIVGAFARLRFLCLITILAHYFYRAFGHLKPYLWKRAS